MTNRPAIFAPSAQPELHAGASMSPIRCPFCEHNSPADAKFCSECGGALHLVPCSKCGAVNDVMAVSCYQCRSPLAGRGAEAPPALPVPAAPVDLPRRQAPRAVLVAASVATIVAGYYAYQRMSSESAREPVAASSPAKPSPAIVADPPVAAPAVPAAASPPTATPRDAPAAVASEKARPRPAEPPKARPAAPPRAALRQATAAGACSAGVAALDLCGPAPAKLDPPGPTAVEPPRERAPVSPREGCAAGLAALGLCPADTNQGGN